MTKLLMDLFGRPSGLLGKIGGRILSITNKELNEWTVSLLEIKSNDKVLEIGFGPGVAAKMISSLIDDGLYIGIDPSEVMLSQARSRNDDAVQNGNVKLIQSIVENLPMFDEPFDKIFSINSIIFWEDPIERLKDLRRQLTPKGQIAITLQPRSKGASDETAYQESEKIIHYLEEAGFSEIRVETKKLKPVLAICVIGKNQLNDSSD